MGGIARRDVLASGVAALASACATLPQAAGETATIARLAASEWAARPQIMVYETPGVSAPHYAEAATALGVARVATMPGMADMAMLAPLRWGRAAGMANTLNHVDANVIGLWAMVAGREACLQTGVPMADAQWDQLDQQRLTSQARYWIDDIWMIGMLQVQAFRVTGAARFVDRAALMADLYLARLQQPNGLFHHGPEAPLHWARGNGWVAAGLAEILAVLPAEHPRRPAVLAGFQRMAQALLATQRGDGLWGQLIDDPAAWSETSGSAMFAHAFLLGSGAGLLDPGPYRAAADRAWRGLVAQLEPDGRLRGVCVGTGQSRDPAYYLARPTVTGDLHGQAPLLWLCAERLRISARA